MKLCSLLICSAAGTCWTVTLVKLSKVTSGNILLTWWKVHRLLLCFDSLWGVALCLSIHEHRAASGGCCVDIILTLLSQFVWVWNSEQQGQGRTVKPGLCVPRKQHHHMGYKLLVRISNFNFLLVQNTVSYKNSSSRYLNMKRDIIMFMTTVLSFLGAGEDLQVGTFYTWRVRPALSMRQIFHI